MSDLFLQNSLNKIFNTETETNLELPQWINIVDHKKDNIENNNKNVSSSIFIGQQGGSNDVNDSATSSAFIGQMGGANDSATSSAFVGQFGGANDSATSSAFVGQFGGANDSATSSAFVGQMGGANDSATSSAFFGQMGGANDSATSSAFVGQPSKTNEMNDSTTSSVFIGQNGGAKSKKQNGGSNADINKLLSMLTSESNNNVNINSETTTETLEAQLREILKQDGGSKKNNHVKQTAGGNTSVADIRNFFVNLKSQGVDVNIKLNDKTLSEYFDLAQNTTTEVSNIGFNKIIGGAKKSPKKSSKKSSKKEELLDGGANAGFQAFLDFKKHVANKLKISNGPSAAKIAGSVNATMKQKYSDLSAVEIAKKNTEYFDKNIDKIKGDFKELIDKNPKK
jgi:hypothetical protein